MEFPDEVKEVKDSHFTRKNPHSDRLGGFGEGQDPRRRQHEQIHQDKERIGSLGRHLVIVGPPPPREEQEIEHQAKEKVGQEYAEDQQEVDISGDVPEERRIEDAEAVQDICERDDQQHRDDIAVAAAADVPLQVGRGAGAHQVVQQIRQNVENVVEQQDRQEGEYDDHRRREEGNAASGLDGRRRLRGEVKNTLPERIAYGKCQQHQLPLFAL